MDKQIRVELGQRSYDVLIGADLSCQIGKLASGIGAGRVVVISDSNVAPLYGQALLDALQASGLDAWAMRPFPAGEPSKTLTTASGLLDELLSHSPAIDRDTLIIPLGGGVAGDMGGFVAAVALRGLRVLQCPTTLLACVDSSVGGKTGVDHQAGKNLIGAFHQPSGVIIDVETLRTLPLAELRNGLGECVKHAVIRDESLLEFIESNAQTLLATDGQGLAFDADVMVELIARNVVIKAAVVSADEREAGLRGHLNFGHTIGHAIETFVGYDNIRHGEAVSLGMVAANCIATARGLLGSGQARRVAKVLAGLQLPTTTGPLDAAEIWQIMQHDKKARHGKVRMVLPSDIGKVDIYDDITPTEVAEAVEAIGK
jgi:3-dehydroquinate synthase